MGFTCSLTQLSKSNVEQMEVPELRVKQGRCATEDLEVGTEELKKHNHGFTPHLNLSMH